MAQTRTTNYLDFDKPIAELEAKINELRFAGDEGGVNIAEEVEKLEEKITISSKKMCRVCSRIYQKTTK